MAAGYKLSLKADAVSLPDVILELTMQNPGLDRSSSLAATYAQSAPPRSVAPVAPVSLKETGISENELISMTVKTLYSLVEATPTTLMEHLKLPHMLIMALIEKMQERRMLEVLGAVSLSSASELRYALSEKGKTQARDAMDVSQYIGPMPVTVEAWVRQIGLQKLANEIVDANAIQANLSSLVVNPLFMRKLGPAMNSGRSILLYGPAGNGKTSVSEKMGRVFQSIIYVPHAVEIDGQYIKVFDPLLHKPVAMPATSSLNALRRNEFDQRWVACSRPFIVVGGELTLEMLDLQFDSLAKLYEAPMHVKAIGGIFMIDDFGRQQVRPTDLLNRWIVPMESRNEYLRLRTGKTLCVPFDTLLIFSTNLSPNDLMDPAFLRRIPYKMLVNGPSDDEFRVIFKRVAEGFSVPVSDEIITYIISIIKSSGPGKLASYMPKFILDQVVATCKYERIEPEIRHDMIDVAISNLFVTDDQ